MEYFDVKNPDVRARLEQAEIVKRACSVRMVDNNEQAKDFLDGMKSELSDHTKGIAKGERVASIRKMSWADMDEKTMRKERAVKLLADSIALPNDIATRNLENNVAVKRMTSTPGTSVKTVADLMYDPRNITYFQDMMALTTENDFDANWMVGFNNVSLSGAGEEAKVFNMLLNSTFDEIGLSGDIQYDDLGTTSMDTVSAERYGKGKKLRMSLYESSPAAALNMALTALRTGEMAKKSELGYAQLTGAGTYSGTVTEATARSAENLAVALNTAGFTLTQKFTSSTTKTFRVTANVGLVLFVRYNANYSAFKTAYEMRNQTGGTGAVETVVHNISIIPSLEVPNLPDTTNEGAILAIPGGKRWAVSFRPLQTNVEEVFDINGLKIGADSIFKIDNQDADQSILVNLF